MVSPLLLSLRVAGLATLFAVVFGIVLAALLARRHSAAANIADATVNLPLVLPPTVLGYYLLVLLGAQSPLGKWLESIGIDLVFTWQGAVVAATIVALPLVVGSTRAAIEAVDPDLRGIVNDLDDEQRKVTRRYDRMARFYDFYDAPMDWMGTRRRRRRLVPKGRSFLFL